MLQRLDESTRELLGLGRDDPWAYASFVALIVGALTTGWASSGAFAMATALFLRFLGRSTPRYLEDGDLSRAARVVGMASNVCLLAGFAGLVTAKVLGRLPPLS